MDLGHIVMETIKEFPTGHGQIWVLKKLPLLQQVENFQQMQMHI